MAPAPLNIVLTNDDGFNAPGIQTLYTALVNAGFNVHIVAPAVNQSAQGSSLGGTAALVNPIDITEFSPGNFFVDGKPATATLTALDDLFAGQPPDLVISSGTNRGDNIGESEISRHGQRRASGFVRRTTLDRDFGRIVHGQLRCSLCKRRQLHGELPARAAGCPGSGAGRSCPAGEGLTINVPGNPALAGSP